MNTNILFSIIIFSGIFGFIYEVIFYYLNSGMKQFYWRGANFLPWIDIYALGALLILLTCSNKGPIGIFLLSGLVCGLLEYVLGLIIYIFRDGYRCWDYNKEKWNFGSIHGFVCLRSVLFFSFSGLILIYILLPISTFLSKFKIFNFCNYVILPILLVDELYNLIIARCTSLPRVIEIYKNKGIHFMEFK